MHKSRSYDYYKKGKERCGWKTVDELISIHLAPANVKTKANKLNTKY